jgi:hypothetical protein
MQQQQMPAQLQVLTHMALAAVAAQIRHNVLVGSYADMSNDMLGGRIRNNLQQACHSILLYVELNTEERAQRKAM